jgi:hypothetical protein
MLKKYSEGCMDRDKEDLVEPRLHNTRRFDIY